MIKILKKNLFLIFLGFLNPLLCSSPLLKSACHQYGTFFSWKKFITLASLSPVLYLIASRSFSYFIIKIFDSYVRPLEPDLKHIGNTFKIINLPHQVSFQRIKVNALNHIFDLTLDFLFYLFYGRLNTSKKKDAEKIIANLRTSTNFNDCKNQLEYIYIKIKLKKVSDLKIAWKSSIKNSWWMHNKTYKREIVIKNDDAMSLEIKHIIQTPRFVVLTIAEANEHPAKKNRKIIKSFLIINLKDDTFSLATHRMAKGYLYHEGNKIEITLKKIPYLKPIIRNKAHPLNQNALITKDRRILPDKTKKLRDDFLGGEGFNTLSIIKTLTKGIFPRHLFKNSLILHKSFDQLKNK